MVDSIVATEWDSEVAVQERSVTGNPRLERRHAGHSLQAAARGDSIHTSGGGGRDDREPPTTYA